MVKRLVLTATLSVLVLAVFASSAHAWGAGGGSGGGGGCGGCGGGAGSAGGGGTLTDSEVYWLGHMRQEEKLARDVYLTMYDRWGAAVFSNIAMSEQRHTDAIESLIDRYGITDPVTNEATRGGFVDPGLSGLYGTLIARGLTSLHEAYLVGVDVETIDIADLKAAISQSGRSDIVNVYGNLLEASQHHLSAFNSRL